MTSKAHADNNSQTTTHKQLKIYAMKPLLSRQEEEQRRNKRHEKPLQLIGNFKSYIEESEDHLKKSGKSGAIITDITILIDLTRQFSEKEKESSWDLTYERANHLNKIHVTLDQIQDNCQFNFSLSYSEPLFNNAVRGVQGGLVVGAVAMVFTISAIYGASPVIIGLVCGGILVGSMMLGAIIAYCLFQASTMENYSTEMLNGISNSINNMANANMSPLSGNSAAFFEEKTQVNNQDGAQMTDPLLVDDVMDEDARTGQNTDNDNSTENTDSSFSTSIS